MRTKNFKFLSIFLLVLLFLASFSSCKNSGKEITTFKTLPELKDVKLDIKNFSIPGHKVNFLDIIDNKLYFLSYKGSVMSGKILEDDVNVDEFDFDNSQLIFHGKIAGFLNSSFEDKFLTFRDNFLFYTEKGADSIHLIRFNILTNEKKIIYDRPITPAQRDGFFQPFSVSYTSKPDYIYERVKLNPTDNKVMVYYIPEDKIFYKDLPPLLGITTYETKNYFYYFVPQNKEMQVFKKPDLTESKVINIGEVDISATSFSIDYNNDYLIFHNSYKSSFEYLDLNKAQVVMNCEITNPTLNELLLPVKKSYIRGISNNNKFNDILIIPTSDWNETSINFFKLSYDAGKNKFNQERRFINLSSYGYFDLESWFLNKSGIMFLLKNKNNENLYLCTYSFKNNKAELYPLNIKLETNFTALNFSATNDYIYFVERFLDFYNNEPDEQFEDILIYFKIPEY